MNGARGRLWWRDAQASDLDPLNQPSTLAIRPEHVILTKVRMELPPTDDATNDIQKTRTNTVRAIIREINFAGETTTVRLDAGGLILETLIIQTDGLKAGDSCLVTLPPERIAVLKTSDG